MRDGYDRPFVDVRGRLRAAILALALGLAGCGGDGGQAPAGTAAEPEVPAPDLSRAEAAVAAAVADARRAVLESPSASTWGALAMVLAAHELPGAVACYRRAAELAPGDDRWPYLAARALRTRDLPAALAELRKAAGLRSRQPAVYVQYGDALLEAGDAGARRQFERALELDPGNAWALFGLGRAALLAGDLRGARQALEQAVAAKANFGEAHALLAQVAQRLGDAEAADLHLWIASNHTLTSAPPDPYYDEVVARGASSRWALRRGEVHAAARRYAEAEAEFRAALAAAPAAAKAWVNLGGALAGQGRVREAVEAYREALAIDPGEVSALSNLGQALLQTGDVAAAARHLETAVEIDSTHVEARLNLGVVRSREGRLEEAAEHFRAVLAARPGELRALEQLARTLAASGREDEALELWRRALTIGPRRLETLYGLAKLLADRGEHREAIELLRRATSIAPNSSRLALLLAWELATAPAAGDRDGRQALRLATRVRRAYPQMPQAADVLAAALAETGDPQAAVREAEAALALADSQGQAALAGDIRGRLDRYRAGSPFRQPGGR